MAKTTLTYSDWRTYAALLIFVFVWLLIAQVPLPRVLRRIGLDSFGRTPATVLGACTIVALGIVSPEEAFASQRPETLLLLAGLMIILGKFEEKGFMEACQRRLLRGKNLTPLKLLVRLSILSGLLAAFLMNDGQPSASLLYYTVSHKLIMKVYRCSVVSVAHCRFHRGKGASGHGAPRSGCCHLRQRRLVDADYRQPQEHAHCRV